AVVVTDAITFGGQLDTPGVASIGGNFGIHFGTSATDPTAIAASDVNVSVSAGSFAASLSHGSLGLLMYEDATMAVQASGSFNLVGGGFANISAGAATLRFNNTSGSVHQNLTVGLATVQMDVDAGSAGRSEDTSELQS